MPTIAHKFIWAEGIEHNGKKGWYVAVIARQLVGSKEVGTISHEYMVM